MVKKYIKKAAKKGVKILKKKGGYSYTAKPKPKSKVKSTDTKIKEMQKEIRRINAKRKLMKRLGLEEYLTGGEPARYELVKKRGYPDEYQLKPEFGGPAIKPKPKSKVKSTNTKTKKMQKAEYILKKPLNELKKMGIDFGLVKRKPKGKPKSLKSATGSKAVVQDISMSKLLNAQDKIRAAAKKAGQMVAIYRKNNPNNPNVKIYNQYMAKKKGKK